MSLASNFVSRVLSFAPLTRKAAAGDEDSAAVKNAAEYLSRSSLLASVDNENDDVTDIWARNLERLREQRMRPFTASAVAVVILSLLTTVVAGSLFFVHYRQMVVADGDQDVVVRIGMGCAGAIAGIALLHAALVWRFASTGGMVLGVRLADFGLKVAVLALLTTTAFTLRLWDDEPVMGGEGGFFAALHNPARTVVLAISGALLVALAATSVASLGLPYRRSGAISVSAIRTLALFAACAAFAQCLLGMSTLVGAPTTFFEDPALWAGLGVGLAVSLIAFSLAGSVHATPEAAEFPRLWLWATAAAVAASATVSVFVYRDAVPIFSLPLAVSDSLFAVAALGFSAALLLAFAMVHMVAWIVNERRPEHKSRHELHWEV